MPQPILTLRNITKSFSSINALSDMSLEIFPGECHAIVGENGAGKSTLIKIMTGVHQPDRGEILHDGQTVQLRTTQEAQMMGVAAIFQEPMVFSDLDVAENIFISQRSHSRFVDWNKMYRDAGEIIARLGVTLDPRRAAAGLTLAEQQTVEIARALSLDVKVLIMDEPTASLSAHEVENLHKIVLALKARGVAIIYISHRLEEIFKIADRVTVIRDGQHISTLPIGEVTHTGMVRDMVGRAVDLLSIKQVADAHGSKVLSAIGLGKAGAFRDVSFDLHAGEILCFAGLIGSRRTDVGLALFGVEPADAGHIVIDEQTVSLQSPDQAMKLGVAYVSEDRRKLGLALSLPIYMNVSLASLKKLVRRLGLLDGAEERRLAELHRKELSIRSPDVMLEVGKLSGGNQQKVMLAKWLETRPRVLILDEPTRGIDVGAKTEVHSIIRKLAAEGVAIIVISSDLPEVLTLADRILVMREGNQMGIFDITGASQEKIMAVATGAATMEHAA
jgi:rhamnose transport system ATP-binding protein